EMFAFCGKRFQVYKRAHKTCDTIFPVRGRRVGNSVHLETRCNGSAHGGCQAKCLLFWKDAWLKPVAGAAGPVLPSKSPVTQTASGCTESDVVAHAFTIGADGEPTYVCQATQLPYASGDLEWWDIRQYFEDYSSGNIGLGRVISGISYFLYYAISQSGIGV